MTSANGGSRLGTTFGVYELQSLIGVGGMGEVYRAYDTVKERMVAVKLLRSEVAADPWYQERFRRESRWRRGCRNPTSSPCTTSATSTASCHRHAPGRGRQPEGRTAHQRPARRRTGAVDLGQVAAALDAAHADGLVHRDIKPENVLLTADDFAYLVDFGIAHAGTDARVTSTGLVIGSCAYMAAERFSGGRVGPAADVYSLACLLYES